MVEEDDEAFKLRMRAEGWKFSSDKPAVPEEEIDDESVDLAEAVCMSGVLVAPMILLALKSAKLERRAHACSAVAALAERDHGRSILLNKSCVEAVVEAMRSAAESDKVALHGCHALANLAMGDGAHAVLRSGGVEATLTAMAAHPASSAVQAKGCLALGNASFVEEGEARVAVANANAFRDVMVCALRLGIDEPSVAEEACDCLSNLAGGEAGLRGLMGMVWIKAGEAGGPATGKDGLRTLLQRLMDAHPRCQSVSECAQAVAAAGEAGSA